jgi:DNA anti-recombination protein RmuC
MAFDDSKTAEIADEVARLYQLIGVFENELVARLETIESQLREYRVLLQSLRDLQERHIAQTESHLVAIRFKIGRV